MARAVMLDAATEVIQLRAQHSAEKEAWAATADALQAERDEARALAEEAVDDLHRRGLPVLALPWR